MSKKILVTGATGYIGGRLIPALLQKGYSVRCLVRNPKMLGKHWEGVEIFQADVLQADILPIALEGIEVAYYLIHSMQKGEAGFEDRDRLAAKNFAQAAKKAGIQQIIYLGGLGHEEDHLSPHLKSRQEVGEILRSTGIPVTEFRAAIIVGSGSISFEMIRYLTERLPVMICPRWVKSLCQPIAIRDVLQYLLEAIEEPKSKNKILEIGGTDILSYKEMMLQYARARGLKRYILEVPVLTPRLSSYWINLITPIPASMAHSLVEGLKSDVICKSNLAREIFPNIHPMGYGAAVQQALI